MKRGLDLAQDRVRHGRYSGTGVSPDVKRHTALIARNLHDTGMSWEMITQNVKTPFYSPKTRTLRKHVAILKTGDTPLSDAKKSGAKAKLSTELWEIVFGWALQETKCVNLDRLQQWIDKNLHTPVSAPTISRHKKEMGLSFQLVGARGWKPEMTRDEYVTGYFDFVKKLRDDGFFAFDPNRVVCIDFVTNSQRRERKTSLNIRGAKQKKISENSPLYTNSYLVAVTLGQESFEVLMFTHDPAFDPKGPRWKEVQNWCDANGIRRDQIYYIKSTKKYCKEDSSQVVAFEQRFREKLRGSRILHDAGGSFKIDKTLILAERAEKVIVLPSEQHGELSVLDNKLNAVAKQVWRQERHNQDFAWDAFLLLVKLESVGEEPIISWWRTNFMLDLPEITCSLVDERLTHVNGDVPLRQYLAEKYLASYDEWCQENDEQELIYEPDVEGGGLDGQYWN
jgi:hypothetical protein